MKPLSTQQLHCTFRHQTALSRTAISTAVIEPTTILPTPWRKAKMAYVAKTVEGPLRDYHYYPHLRALCDCLRINLV